MRKLYCGKTPFGSSFAHTYYSNSAVKCFTRFSFIELMYYQYVDGLVITNIVALVSMKMHWEKIESANQNK